MGNTSCEVRRGAMPWKETGPVLERVRFIDDCLSGFYTITELAPALQRQPAHTAQVALTARCTTSDGTCSLVRFPFQPVRTDASRFRARPPPARAPARHPLGQWQPLRFSRPGAAFPAFSLVDSPRHPRRAHRSRTSRAERRARADAPRSQSSDHPSSRVNAQASTRALRSLRTPNVSAR